MFTGRLGKIVGSPRAWAALVFLLSGLLLARSAGAADIPADFKITLTSASLGPPRKPPDTQSVTIDASGTATLSAIPSPKGLLPATTLKLDAAAVAGIYQAVQAQRFFDLKPEYRDSTVQDGDEAILTVTAGGKTKTVTSVNVRVLPFDTIAVTIDRALPPDRRLQYNALTDPSYRAVER